MANDDKVSPDEFSSARWEQIGMWMETKLRAERLSILSATYGAEMAPAIRGLAAELRTRIGSGLQRLANDRSQELRACSFSFPNIGAEEDVFEAIPREVAKLQDELTNAKAELMLARGALREAGVDKFKGTIADGVIGLFSVAFREIRKATLRATVAEKALGESPLPLRPVLRRFAQAMERELRANDHKGGWERDAPEELLRRVREEYIELDVEVGKGDKDPACILSESADVANMSMMVADRCGAFGQVIGQRMEPEAKPLLAMPYLRWEAVTKAFAEGHLPGAKVVVERTVVSVEWQGHRIFTTDLEDLALEVASNADFPVSLATGDA